MNHPRPLKPGDTILLIAPSSPLRTVTAEEIEAGLTRRGYRVRIAPSCRSHSVRGYAAGPAALRARDIMDGFTDPTVDAIWAVRGGSMGAEVLPLLDYEVLKQHPKPFLGFSDITSLHTALQQRADMATLHAPCASTLAADDADPYTMDRLLEALAMPMEQTFVNPGDRPIEVIRDGRASGTLIGGNLTVITSLCGTPWALSARDRIVFLEDIDEDVYRLDRMLLQLRLGGMFDECAGVLLGDFTDSRNTYNRAYGPRELLREFFAELDKPVYANLSVGHIRRNAALPLGTRCTMENGSIRFTRE